MNMLKEQAAKSSPPKYYYKETTALQAFQVLIIRNQANKIAVSLSSTLRCRQSMYNTLEQKSAML